MQKQASLIVSDILLPSSNSNGRLWLLTLGRIAAANGHVRTGKTTEERKRIMVVDDEEDIAQLFKSGLERNGFSVEIFNDPLEALSSFKPHYYDLLLLDVRMPAMSGFELYREIKKKDNSARVCFVSAFEVHEEELRNYLPWREEKCIVKKPISIKDLVKIIGEEIGKG